MSGRTAIYWKKKIGSPDLFLAEKWHRIFEIRNAPLKGPDAMIYRGAVCPDDCQVGWYYNEKENTFLSAEKYHEKYPLGDGEFITSERIAAQQGVEINFDRSK